MNLKLKILTLSLLVCLTLTFGISVSAEESLGASDGTPEISEKPSAEGDEAFAESESSALPEEGAPEEINPFDRVYNLALSHASEIFSLLSLIGTIIISYFYKRGLLPSVKGVLGNISASVIKLKETSEREIESRKEECAKTESRLDSFDDSLKAQGELISSLESRLISEEDIYRQRERSLVILSAQVDMLYDIFMSSSLPHYQKEAMSEKINAMRKELSAYEE